MLVNRSRWDHCTQLQTPWSVACFSEISEETDRYRMTYLPWRQVGRGGGWREIGDPDSGKCSLVKGMGPLNVCNPMKNNLAMVYLAVVQ